MDLLKLVAVAVCFFGGGVVVGFYAASMIAPNETAIERQIRNLETENNNLRRVMAELEAKPKPEMAGTVKPQP